MHDLQLVIFDCDGVLVDSEVISNDVLARSLTDQGLPTTLTEARRDYQGVLVCVASQGKLELCRYPHKVNYVPRRVMSCSSRGRCPLVVVGGAGAT